MATLKADLFKALGHPSRIRVLEVLVEGERPVGELAGALKLEFSHLSQHLAVLRRAGVVTARRVGSTVFYGLRDPRMSQLLNVARQMLVTSLEDSRQILDHLRESGPTGEPPDSHPERPSLAPSRGGRG